MTTTPPSFRPDEGFAHALDAADPLRSCREWFVLPRRPDGRPAIYFCGHSLGLQPRAAQTLVAEELDAWANHAVDAHFRDPRPWYSYHENVRAFGARLMGAREDEVVFMNSLTVNLHLMLTTFYRPDRQRWRIVVDEPTFPSDRYALQSQIQLHGLDPRSDLLTLTPRPGESLLRTEDIEELLERRGPEIAVVLLNGVNFFTGQFFDLPRITAAARRQGCAVGLDLAHAAGNVPLQLHDWNVDFAIWCSYKYLNSGPGGVGGCFIHERNGQNPTLPRLAGWWGNDPATRFRMHLLPDFTPQPGAAGWQLSNPPILAMAPLLASLDIFDRVGMSALREKSERLTGYLEYLLDQVSPGRFEVLTPRDPAQRGCQLSILVHDRPRELLKALESAGVVCDFREPNVIRVAPVPLYNTYAEVWSFAQVLAKA